MNFFEIMLQDFLYYTAKWWGFNPGVKQNEPNSSSLRDEKAEEIAATAEIQTPLEDKKQYGPETLDEFKGRMMASYLHCKTRVKERYDLELDPGVWRAWNGAISNQKAEALFLQNNEEHNSELWRVWLDRKVLFVCFKADCVVTALPAKKSYDFLVRTALRERAREFMQRERENTRKAAEKPKASPINPLVSPKSVIVKTMPPLEQRLLRNPHELKKHIKNKGRNENALAELKQRALTETLTQPMHKNARSDDNNPMAQLAGVTRRL